MGVRPCECGYYDIQRQHSKTGGGMCEFREARNRGWSSDACGPAAIWHSPDGRRIAARHLKKALAGDGDE